ncbi:MAG: HAMP domain-containing sensor histidine kinase [Anaerolineae bacterium]
MIERQQIDVRYRTMVNRPVGLPIPVEIHMQAVHDEVGREMFFAGTLADITEKLEQEKQATELVLKARTVEALKGFLNGVSHDLRTPLSTVITTCYLLRRRLEGNTALLGYINRLEEQVNILIRSVEDMLEMSHLDEDMVEFAFIKVNVNTLIRDVMVGLKTVAYGHHQNLNFEPFSQPLFVMADQLMLGKVVRNLVQNALYYTPSGGTITVQTTQSEGWITITVKDTGIGIASADLSQIFDRFYKADKARTGGTTGTGLGLPIVKKIVEIHNGIVEVSSEVGRGSSFKVRLPMVEDGSKKSESDTPPATPDVAISAL